MSMMIVVGALKLILSLQFKFSLAPLEQYLYFQNAIFFFNYIFLLSITHCTHLVKCSRYEHSIKFPMYT